LKRAVKATLAAGVNVDRVEVQPDGKITIIASCHDHDQQAPAAGKNEWDDL
jgi:hypothetical protein